MPNSEHPVLHFPEEDQGQLRWSGIALSQEWTSSPCVNPRASSQVKWLILMVKFFQLGFGSRSRRVFLFSKSNIHGIDLLQRLRSHSLSLGRLYRFLRRLEVER